MSLKPVTVLGRPCALAGVFGGIQSCVHRVMRADVHFGPSVVVRDVVRGPELDELCARLRIITADGLPIPRQTVFRRWRDRFRLAAGVSFVAAFLTLAAGPLLKDWTCGSFLALGLLGALMLASARATHDADNPLPVGVVTFRDWSVAVARHLADCGVNPPAESPKQ